MFKSRNRTSQAPRSRLLRTALWLPLCALTPVTIPPATAAVPNPISLDSLAIIVTSPSRSYVYTNKESAFLYGEINNENSPGWQGFTVFNHRFVSDYLLIVDGKELDRRFAESTAYPDFFRRKYKEGIIEEVHPIDSLAGFFVTIASAKPVEVTVIPLLIDGRDLKDFRIGLSPSTALIASKRHLQRSASEDYPAWIAVHAPGLLPVRKLTRTRSGTGVVALYSQRSKSVIVTFAVGDRGETADSLARRIFAQRSELSEARRLRMVKLLDESPVETGNAQFDKALAWAKLSLDALIMNQVSHGIFAGLPWFDSYWGRDTFISLPGASLVTGREAEARRLLESFAEFQQRDSLSPDFGRIPNIVTNTDTGYNTADATPRFVDMVRAYVERTGDERFGFLMYPIILRSIDGTLRYHVDSLGFLTHGDAETWMDAVGPSGPWSPRGNRANDIQALWAKQLEAGIFFATRIGDATSARKWNDVLLGLQMNFPPYFLTPKGIADRLRVDGTPDMKLRPNQIFTLPLLPGSEKAHVVEQVVSRLTYPYGVASLSQDDPDFHPYHHHPPFYPKDAAYHNGTVWTWLQGPVISALCERGAADLAFHLTLDASHQILDLGSVGTQSELLDALPLPGKSYPRLSGTVSQAWNLAEFVRNFYEDYLGAKIRGLDSTVTIEPHVPGKIRKITATIPALGGALTISYNQQNGKKNVTIASSEATSSVKISVRLRTSNGIAAVNNLELAPGNRISVRVMGERVSVVRDGKTTPSNHPWIPLPPFSQLRKHLRFARPVLHKGLLALKEPPYLLLSHSQIVQENPRAAIIVNASDPAGDDTGATGYVYPRSSAFIAGCFDIRSLSISSDSRNVYFRIGFRTLSDPGWHPEYGFQLTFAAIAIDEDEKRGSGSRTIGRNALFTLPDLLGFEKVIYVGGGLQVDSGDGTTLAAYAPVESDASRPFGDASTGVVRFAIPVSIIGRPSRHWRVTVVSGGQDDHGGAGLGEFRTVLTSPGEWNGGGKLRPGDPNIYDVLVAQSGK
jgi:glycogen debranching enzyme